MLRDPTRKDKEGKPQAKGIAFAEFSDHEHALCALRQLNNNPRPFGEYRCQCIPGLPQSTFLWGKLTQFKGLIFRLKGQTMWGRKTGGGRVRV